MLVAKALLRFDPFEEAWDYLGADIGPRNGELTSSNVDRMLANLRNCG